MSIHVSTSGTLRNPIGKRARKNMCIAVGFGGAAVYKDGKMVLNGERNPPRRYRNKDGYVTVRHAEKYAKRHGPGAYEIRIDAPLWSAAWRRLYPGKWVVVEAGLGFA